MPKIVVFGATGYTGRLTAEALIAQGDSPVLAGRDAAALATLAAELGGAATAVADVADPASVTALLERGDVLVTTVGPFLRYGGPALAAALAGGAHYLDSTGEGPFVRTVFDHDEQARAAGVALLTALGFDYVPGNLAAGLALREAPSAVRVDVGYFMDGPATSGGTRASVAGMLFERGFALRDGKVVTEPAAAHLRDFDVAGKPRTAVSIPGSEHFALPRTHPNLRSIDVFLGLPSVAAHGMRLGSRLAATAAQLPPLKHGLEAALARIVKGSTGGPDARTRARTRGWAVAEAYDASDHLLASVTLTGGDPYDFTAHLLAWAAHTALNDGLLTTGALGPVAAFGLDALHAAVDEAGWTRMG
ncbi:saccharopine dehydrogenase [Nocardia otitidiscaviarum]|uniref:Saccharopine dehydrogenase n=1 Tax=Nocardia otitidiscaviarum TaxID=1823 RepID=A0A516NNA3_9NOCA|nr:saccharopine dehydrogenase NADP-binding domain-containing protein [Nocardia otitidiscaviarum]MCP9624405.1 saccharopine dehydrogenase NADP-binding domain-containing protein [Nocardia otitidiscaviarum]QDP80377.1 saccharopine dehydrogenase [Nocardia otitidiscaviarum]